MFSAIGNARHVLLTALLVTSVVAQGALLNSLLSDAQSIYTVVTSVLQTGSQLNATSGTNGTELSATGLSLEQSSASASISSALSNSLMTVAPSSANGVSTLRTSMISTSDSEGSITHETTMSDKSTASSPATSTADFSSSSSSQHGELSGGTRAGIGVGVTIAVLTLCIVAFWQLRRRRKRVPKRSTLTAGTSADQHSATETKALPEKQYSGVQVQDITATDSTEQHQNPEQTHHSSRSQNDYVNARYGFGPPPQSAI